MNLPVRKKNRLDASIYSGSGAYFITICTERRRNLFCRIAPTSIDTVGAGVLDRPQITLLPHGVIINKYIQQLNEHYKNISVDTYVIMPNHIHLLLRILPDGRSGTPAPTKGNSVIAQFVSTLKRFCNQEYGENIFQRSYHDHIIRNEKDYQEIWNYIDTNPQQWMLDRYYTP